MTYDEALEIVGYVRMIRRAGWHRLKAVSEVDDEFDDMGKQKPGAYFNPNGTYTWYGDRMLAIWNLDNGDGEPGGSFCKYEPTADDISATDWEIYDAMKLWNDADD